MSGTFAPAPSAAPRARMVVEHAQMEARLLLRNGEQVGLALVIPLVVLVAGVIAAERLGLSSDEPVAELVPGVIALAVMSTSFTSLAIATGFERRSGVLKWLGSSPLPRSGLLLGKVGALLLVELAQLVCIGALAVALGWRPGLALAGSVGLVTGIVAGTLAFASLGLLLAGSLRAEATLAAANLVYVLLAIAGGVVVAPSEYGEVGRVLALLPSGALHEAVATALSGSMPWAPSGVLLGWAGVGTTLATRTFRWE